MMYVVSCSNKELSLSSTSNGLSESVWSWCFHQVSIGTNRTNKFHTHLTGMFKEDQCCTESSSLSDSLGFIPENTQDLSKHVSNFMGGLPSATIVCLSVLTRVGSFFYFPRRF
ncbi:hypothetical protein RYX36_023039 [Vicia faba]